MTLRGRRQRWTLAFAVALVITMSATTSSVASQSAPMGVRGTEGSLTYEAADRDDGLRHLNTPRMIERLQELNVNTYVFPITSRSTNWPDLRDEFLPAAAEAGIDVWVMLSPPSAPHCCSAPYGSDYVGWAGAIAEASTAHPNLTGWTIDDYAYDLRTFTPSYAQAMTSTADAINPELDFLPIVYFAQMSTAFLTDHGRLIDGIIFPYWDDPDRNTSWSWSLSYQLGVLADRLAPHDGSLYLMPYAYPLSHALQPPTVEYVEHVTATGLAQVAAGRIDGVVQYKLPLVRQHEKWYRPPSENMAYAGNGRLSFVVQPDTRTTAGQWCGASRTVRPDPGADSYTISFRHADGRGSSEPSGYHAKQLLVDGAVVWEQDVASDRINEWYRVQLDLTEQMRDKASVRLQWRLYERQGVSNYWVDVGIDDIQTSGFDLSDPGVESADAWRGGLERKGGSVYCSAQIYHEQYGADAGAVISELYSGR